MRIKEDSGCQVPEMPAQDKMLTDFLFLFPSPHLFVLFLSSSSPLFFLLFTEESHLTESLLLWFLLSAAIPNWEKKIQLCLCALAVNFHHIESSL